MKKKLTISILIILTFTLSLVSSIFVTMINYEYMSNTKTCLKNNNDMVISIINSNKIKNSKDFINSNLKNTDVRVTIINNKGEVVADSKHNVLKHENYNNKEEINEALKQKHGYCLRKSSISGVDNLYYATKMDTGYIVRSSTHIKQINFWNTNYVKYYIYIILISVIISFLFASRISQIMIIPIKDLNHVTSKIAKGELDRRVMINSEDEIGRLGKNFNRMAEKLQKTLTEVRDEQHRLEAILKSMNSGVIAVDKDFNVILINPYARKIFNIKDDIIGKKFFESIKEKEFEKILKDSKLKVKEINMVNPEKRTLRVKTTNIISKCDLLGKVAVVQDITDMKKLENMRAQFVANVSHELKTPLTSIKGFAETLKYVEDEETKEKFLHIINDEAERLTRLINDILVLSDIEKINNKLTVDMVNVNEVVENVVCLVNKMALDKKIDLFVEKGNLPIVKGSRDAYKQMIINLVDNAIKYTEENGKVYIKTWSDKNNINISIKDTGVGIDKDQINRIFERFYRVDKARSRRQGGTGLGLAIVKHIILNLNGNITVDSKLNDGSNFEVNIPIDEKSYD